MSSGTDEFGTPYDLTEFPMKMPTHGCPCRCHKDVIACKYCDECFKFHGVSWDHFKHSKQISDYRHIEEIEKKDIGF